MHEWVKDLENIQTEIDVLQYQTEKKDVSNFGEEKKVIVSELTVAADEIRNVLVIKKDKINAINELLNSFNGIFKEVFLKSKIQRKSVDQIADELNYSSQNISSFMQEIDHILEFYSEY